MPKSSTHNFAIPALLAFAVLLAWPSARADTLESIKERLAGLDRTIAGRKSEIAETSKQLDRLSSEIDVIKKKHAHDPTILRQYRLQTRLREAQEVSDRLAQMTERAREDEKARLLVRRTLVAELDRAIETKRDIANSGAENSKVRNAAAHDMERFLLERMQISSELSSGSLPENTATLFRNETSQDDRQEQVTALRDLESRMKSEVAWLLSELAEARRQRFLRNEVSHLMDEEAFFAEQGFVRGENTSVASAASPPAQPGVGTRGKVNPLPSDATNPDTSLQKALRDPLAQLAGEFGLPPEQKRDVQTRTASTDGQIAWLENRIATIRLFLDRLRLKTEELERPALPQ